MKALIAVGLLALAGCSSHAITTTRPPAVRATPTAAATANATASPSSDAPVMDCVVMPNTVATNYEGMPKIMAARVVIVIPSGAQTINISSVAVAYYDKSGTELGSSTIPGPGFITPGQAMTTPPDATEAAPAGAATCQVVQYYYG